MTEPSLLRCQKCGRPLGYVTITARGLTSIPQRVRDMKLIAICMECFHKN